MADVNERPPQPEPTFTVDGEFIKTEVRAALRSYFMPFSGIVAAITGNEVELVHRDRRGRLMKRRSRKSARIR